MIKRIITDHVHTRAIDNNDTQSMSDFQNVKIWLQLLPII
jgi:hypothetical protein